MDAEKLSVFDNEYFAVNKKLQIITGLWPYTSTFDKMLRRVIICTVLFFLAAPHVIAIKMWCGKDLALCGENIAGLLYASGVVSKFSTTIVCEGQITKAYQLLAANWLTIQEPEERKILREYAAIGKLISIVYLGYMILAGVAFSQFTMLYIAYDFVFPLNESRPKLLVVRGEYLIDPYKYYYELYVMYCVATAVSVAVFVSVDTAYVAVVHQSLATFNIVKFRLHKATTYYMADKQLGYHTIISAIRMHKDALQLSMHLPMDLKVFSLQFICKLFIDVIENSYGPCLLYLVTITAIFLSVGAITILEHKNHPLDLIRFSLIELGVVFHLFYVSWPGQKVMDHSSDLFLEMYTCQWYQINKRGKTLLQIMMLKCLKPTLLTACGFYNMSFENYAAMLKTTMSYITLALSFRE